MTHYVFSDAGTPHECGFIDWRRDEAESVCGRVEGEPVEADPDPEEVCELCQSDDEDEDAD